VGTVPGFARTLTTANLLGPRSTRPLIGAGSGQVGLDNPSPGEDPAAAKAHDGPVTKRAAGLTSTILAASIAAVLVGSQVLASAGPTTPGLKQPVPAASSNSPDASDDDGDADCTNDACGNARSTAVQAWIKCKAIKGKDACVKPAPPGMDVGHTKHSGTAPGPASADGHGHGWGRAHAPGQLKNKSDDDQDADDQDADDPTD